MGRCQGGFCGPRVLELLARERGVSPVDVMQDREGMYIAAYLAGLAVGVWSSKQEIKKLWSYDVTFELYMDKQSRNKLLRGWTKAIGRSLDWEERA